MKKKISLALFFVTSVLFNGMAFADTIGNPINWVTCLVGEKSSGNYTEYKFYNASLMVLKTNYSRLPGYTSNSDVFKGVIQEFNESEQVFSANAVFYLNGGVDSFTVDLTSGQTVGIKSHYVKYHIERVNMNGTYLNGNFRTTKPLKCSAVRKDSQSW